MTVHYHVVDIAIDLNECLVLFSLLIFSLLQQHLNVLWEEGRLDCIDDVEQVLSVDSFHSSTNFIVQVWKEPVDLFVFHHILDKVLHTQLRHSWNVHHRDLTVRQVLRSLDKLEG